MRLALPQLHPGLQIWDTATPLISALQDQPLKAFSFVGSYDDGSRFRTVQLRQVTGLTFIMRSGGLLGIHGHTKESSEADVPAVCTSQRTRPFLCSIYVPLSATDCFTAIEVQRLPDRIFQILVTHLHKNPFTLSLSLLDISVNVHVV